MTLSVGVEVKGSTNAVDRSGSRTISLSWIFWKPRMLDPSNPIPSWRESRVNLWNGTEKCCQPPTRSTNFTSTSRIPAFPAQSTVSSGAGRVQLKVGISSVVIAYLQVFLIVCRQHRGVIGTREQKTAPPFVLGAQEERAAQHG